MPSKEEIIESRRANLPLPEQPPAAPDFNSADGRLTNVGSGGVSADISGDGAASSSLRGPATADSDVRTAGDEWKTNTAGSDVGRQAQDGLDGLPDDAVTKEKKNVAKTAPTTGEDYGYPQKSDPSSGIK